MSVLVNKDTRLVVQGITGSAGSFHTIQCMEYGTNVVAGVTPGKGGQKFQDTVPVFDTVQNAVDKEGANVAAIYVPPPFAADSILDAIDAETAVIWQHASLRRWCTYPVYPWQTAVESRHVCSVTSRRET